MDGDAKTGRERRWRGHLAAWSRSGLSQAAYCRQHGLTPNDFSWWKREIARRTVVTAATFVPVSIAQSPENPYAFEVSLRGGRTLSFDGRVDPEALNAVVSVLEAAGLKPGAGPC